MGIICNVLLHPRGRGEVLRFQCYKPDLFEGTFAGSVRSPHGVSSYVLWFEPEPGMKRTASGFPGGGSLTTQKRISVSENVDLKG